MNNKRNRVNRVIRVDDAQLSHNFHSHLYYRNTTLYNMGERNREQILFSDYYLIPKLTTSSL